MNMIACSKKCRHQLEGYCGLNHITSLTNDTAGSNCGYYEEKRKEAKQEQWERSAEELERL